MPISLSPRSVRSMAAVAALSAAALALSPTAQARTPRPPASSAAVTGTDGCTPVPGTKRPTWLPLAGTTVQETENAQWYKDWRSTTTTLCTDFNRIDPVKYPDWGTRLHRTDHELLYRGDGRKPDVVFKEGFRPWDENGTIDIATGGGRDGRSTAMVSTAYAPSSAILFARTGTYVYVVDAPGGLDVDLARGMPSGYSESEIDFVGGVRPEFIRGAFLVEGEAADDRKFTRYVPNPGFRGGPEAVTPAGFYDIRASAGPRSSAAVHLDTPDSRHRNGTKVTATVERTTPHLVDPGHRELRFAGWYINGTRVGGDAETITLDGSEQLDGQVVLEAQFY